jgi:hypothetical protein
VPVKIFAGFCVEIDKLILKVNWKIKKTYSSNCICRLSVIMTKCLRQSTKRKVHFGSELKRL